MTGEKFLESIRYLDLEIDALDKDRCKMMDRRRDILEQAEAFSAGFDNVHVQSNPSSRTENIGIQLAELMSCEEVAARINQYQEMINRKIDELVDRKQKAQEIICLIPDARYRALLIHRYLSNLRWSSIADIMGYSQDWVEIRLKRQAVEAFEAAENRQVKTGIL